MKAPIRLRVFFQLLLALLGCERAMAQNFGLSLSNSPNPVFVGDTLTYTITVTNHFSSGNVIVTNFLPSSVQFVGASNSFFGGTITNNPGQVVFGLGFSFLPGNVATLTVSVIPTNSGPLNDIAIVATQGANDAVTATSSIFAANPNASLGVSITGPSVAVLANDWMTYSVTVTNTGTNTANNVLLSNTLPAGVTVIGVTPPPPPFSFSNNVIVFSLGALSVGAADTFTFTVQPTSSGTNIFTVGAIADHATNVIAGTNIIVLPFDTSQLVAVNFSGMTYNPQNGLMEQTVQLSNIGTNTLAGARVIVSGLTNRLYNAVGTNNGNPFVQYGGTLNPGQSVNLLMEYVVPTRLPITVLNSAYAAVPVPAPNLSPLGGTPFAITLVTNLPDGRLLIEFQSIPGRSYTILYADNPQMTNSLAAQPVVIAPADRVQWIDDGPPVTVSAPANVSSRFYSVLLNP